MGEGVLHDIEGISAGHWTNTPGQTGCTVILFERPALAAVDVRGAAPGTRETDLLRSDRLVRRVEALLLSGGSAFGLAAADGVVRFLRERGRGFPTPTGPVPIVPAAVIYDLAVGSAIAPGPAEGYAACQAAGPLTTLPRGRVGAGSGATIGKIRPEPVQRGGVGVGHIGWKGGSVTAIAVVNAFGVIADQTTVHRENGAAALRSDPRLDVIATGGVEATLGTATTLGVILVDAPSDHPTLMRCAASAHDGFARIIHPCHTLFDGDLVFAAAMVEGTPTTTESLRISLATEVAVERAILDAVAAAAAPT